MPGFHTEVRLAPSQLPWEGHADVIKITSESCEIMDYKTGAADPDHLEQLRIYAYLWLHDEEVNPAAEPATSLTIVYPGAAYSVEPPSPAAMEELGKELEQRANRGQAALSQRPPAALVGTDACRFCDVKHLCEDYWSPYGQELIHEASVPTMRSVQVEVLQSRGPRSWMTVVNADPYLPAGTHALLTTQDPIDVRPGGQLRLIDVWISSPSEEGQYALRLVSGSEVYYLS
jgi:hypothetical protein